MIRIKEYKIEESTSIRVIETAEVEIPITFSLEDKEQIITLKLYYEEITIKDVDDETLLSYFLIENNDCQIDREDVAEEVLNYLDEVIFQQSVIEDICNYIDKIVDETIKKYDIDE